ncbi:hypothetical protein BV22DRAFT_1039405 [Leucogyrophana mollusca]|uniref:Uncharacterized protein n=1 Tax=Leucogyrophana mollusca TaxID=85980 RepID=A0ACB8B7C5_9AGAM|nr:hypothetical protein BV22DRAFT_1039405 [Leucogyrophana mollusca]
MNSISHARQTVRRNSSHTSPELQRSLSSSPLSEVRDIVPAHHKPVHVNAIGPTRRSRGRPGWQDHSASKGLHAGSSRASDRDTNPPQSPGVWRIDKERILRSQEAAQSARRRSPLRRLPNPRTSNARPPTMTFMMDLERVLRELSYSGPVSTRMPTPPGSPEALRDDPLLASSWLH